MIVIQYCQQAKRIGTRHETDIYCRKMPAWQRGKSDRHTSSDPLREGRLRTISHVSFGRRGGSRRRLQAYERAVFLSCTGDRYG